MTHLTPLQQTTLNSLINKRRFNLLQGTPTLPGSLPVIPLFGSGTEQPAIMPLQSLAWLLGFVVVTSVSLCILGHCLNILDSLLDAIECAITLFATMWTCVSALKDLALTAVTTATSVLNTYNNVAYIPIVGPGVAIITTLTAGWFGCQCDWSPVTKHFNQCVARLETPFNAICKAIDSISSFMQKQSRPRWILAHIGILVVFLGVVWALTVVMATMYCIIIPVVLPVYFVYRKVRLSLEQRQKADDNQIAMVEQYQQFVIQMFKDSDDAMSSIQQPLRNSAVLIDLKQDPFWKAHYDNVPVATPSRRASFPIFVLGLSVVIVWMYLCAVPYPLDKAFSPSLDGCRDLHSNYACLECAARHTNKTETFQNDEDYYACAKNLMATQSSGSQSPKLGQAFCNVPSFLMVQSWGVPLGCDSATTGTAFDTVQQLLKDARTQLQSVRIHSALWCAFSWWLYLVVCSFVLWLGCWLLIS
jgi:hypothetical protein